MNYFWEKEKLFGCKDLKKKDYKFPTDWEDSLVIYYDLDSIDFCNILNTIPNEKEARKIAAVCSEENARGELLKIKLPI